MVVIAINDMRGDKLVQESGYCLDADEPAGETCHHHKTRMLIGPAIVLEVLFRFGQHAEQR